MSFIIPQEVFDKYNEAVDAMIDSNFGVECTLYYPAVKSICPNCVFNPMTNSSSNKYKAGGPISFDGEICPYCDGVGYTQEEETDTIKLRCYFDRKSWLKLPVELKVPQTSLITYGHLSDMPKCQRANYIRTNTAQDLYGGSRYRLSGTPVIHGFKKNKYFIAGWEKFE